MADAVEEGAIVGTECEGGDRMKGLRSALFFEGEEGAAVVEGIAEKFDGEIVAAEFAFEAESARDPPDGGVVEEEGFDDGLEEVDEVVVSSDVGEFMREDGGELRRGEADDRGSGEEDDGPKPTDECGDFDEGGHEEIDPTSNTERAGQLFEPGEKFRRR